MRAAAVRGLQLSDQLLAALQRCRVALVWGQRQEIVQRPDLRTDLLLEVLSLANEVGQLRILRGGAQARSGERALDRVTAHDVGKAERLFADVGPGQRRRARQQRQIVLHD